MPVLFFCSSFCSLLVKRTEKSTGYRPDCKYTDFASFPVKTLEMGGGGRGDSD